MARDSVMWDHLPTDALIQHTTTGNYGLAPRRWQVQLQEIRDLPETSDDHDDREGGT